MLDTLDARLAQARASERGHLEFLKVLCRDEVARRDRAAFARWLRRAHFEEQVPLEGFDFHANPKLPAAQVRDLATLRWLDAGESVILTGPAGVGKAFVAQAVARQAIRHGADVRFAETRRVVAELPGGHADHSWARRLRALVCPRCRSARRASVARVVVRNVAGWPSILSTLNSLTCTDG
ncbi:hypothetical protein PSU4_60300 [Pseudonocardia sulfidoxydans NBRC 16205]|uniref:IstB-like ATP-binding domain-containing protein n=2 Tax=Pseudonocardia sulfidoxydans TaxID=54011 RepID=A0A511DQF4_9PSEU|nr:hypothetical protein PSU4_60300 [Pseudonocardia sulfidoxydans NBRC 16205]